MRISATGGPDPARLSGRENGFTLVELMVVLVILGLVSAAVVLALPGNRSALLSDAREFAARAGATRDKAMIDARSTSIRVTALGYAFDQRGRDGWKPVNGDVTQGLLWREGTHALIADGQTQRIVFDSTGVVEPAQVTLERGGQQVAVTIGYDGKIDVAA